MLPEVGGLELLAIAALALIVIGPKDLPVVLRKLGKFVGKMRAMAQEFRSSFDELARQSELDELRKEVEAMRLAQTYDPTGLVPGPYGVQPGFEPEPEAQPQPYPAPEPAAEPAPKPRRAKPAAKSPAKPKKTTSSKSRAAPARPRRAKAAPEVGQ